MSGGKLIKFLMRTDEWEQSSGVLFGCVENDESLNIRDKGGKISKYLKLMPFLKKQSLCHETNKSKNLTREVNRFLREIPSM